jgi:hypothetical protein
MFQKENSDGERRLTIGTSLAVEAFCKLEPIQD